MSVFSLVTRRLPPSAALATAALGAAILVATTVAPLPLRADDPPAAAPGDGGEAEDPAKREARVRALVKKLGDTDWAVREDAQEALSKEGPEILAVLEDALKRSAEDPELEWRLVEVLKSIRWRLPEPAASEVGDLFEGYADRPPVERGAVVRALIAAGEVARPALLKVARFDEDGELKGQATAAIVDMPPDAETDAALLQTLPTESESAQTHALRGALLARLGKSDEALAALEKARAIGTDDPKVEVRYAEVLHATGQTQKAVDVLIGLVEKTPDDVHLRIKLGKALLDLERVEEATKVFDSVKDILKGAQDPSPYVEVVQALLDAKQTDQAIETARAALGTFPFVTGLNEVLGDALLAADKPGEALLNYRIELQYIDLQTPGGRALGQKIVKLLEDHGFAFTAADPELLPDLKRNVVDPIAHHLVAERLAVRGLTEAALEESGIAAMLRPGSRGAPLWAAWGERLAAAGKIDEAKKVLERAIGYTRSAREKKRLEELVAGLDDGGAADAAAAERRAAEEAAAKAALASWAYRSSIDPDLEAPTKAAGVASLARPIRVSPASGSDAASLVVAFLAGTGDVIAVDEEIGKRRLRFRPEAASAEGIKSNEEAVIAPAALVPGKDGAFYAIYNRTIREPDRPRSSARSGGLEVFLVDGREGIVRDSFVLQGEAVSGLVVAGDDTIAWLSEVAPGIARLAAASLTEKRTLWNHRFKGLAMGDPVVAAGYVLQAVDRGVLRVKLEDGTIYHPSARTNKRVGPRSGLIRAEGREAKDALYYMQSGGVLVRYDAAAGEGHPLLELPARGVSTVAIANERCFVAGRGAEVHAFALPADLAPPSDEAAEPPEAELIWTATLARTADRRLALAGDRLLSLSGAFDSYRGERPTVTVLEPATGAVIGRREVSRPATWRVLADDLVAVAGGNVRAGGGFTLTGITFGRKVDPRRRLLEDLSDMVIELEALGEDRAAKLATKRLIDARGKRIASDVQRLGATYRRLRQRDRAKELFEEAFALAKADGDEVLTGRLRALIDEIAAEEKEESDDSEGTGPTEEKKDPEPGDGDDGEDGGD